MQEGENTYEMDFPLLKEEVLIDWFTIQAFMKHFSDGHANAYILVYRSGEKHLLQSIANQYVYSNCDYFIYLDAKRNRYTMLNHSSLCAPLPPTHCEDYSSELIQYARNFVVPEDQEMVIKEMKLSHVLEVLNRSEVHSFDCGVMEPVRGYTRKRLDYRFYDRPSQMILLSQTDITDVYLATQKHLLALQAALLRAQTDPLTGLLNYQATLDKISDRLIYEDGPFALMFIDLDNFKTVNDTLGHAEGDKLLRQIAQILRSNTKDHDLVGRVGGDEFVVFLRWNKTKEEVKAYAQRICDDIKNFPRVTNQLPPVSCSIGIALFPEDGKDYQTLVRKADRLVYQAKIAGKNRYAI